MKFDRRDFLKFSGAAALSAAASDAFSQLHIQITGVGANRMPLALATFHGTDASQIDLTKVIASDLSRTGAFRLVDSDYELSAEEVLRPNLLEWQQKEANAVVTGSINRQVDGAWDIRYHLFDTVKGELLDEMNYIATDAQLRMTSHRIADRVYDKLTGLGAMFASRLAYVCQYGPTSYELIVAESDGANPRAALRSSEPIISPAWSPDGRHLAYVSFESKKPVVYVHTVATGKRRVVANFKGNNSAPAFSPDGNSLALALSRDGFTQLFLIAADGSDVKRLSRSYAIDTEPVFSADGRSVFFTSDRGGTAQIYCQNLESGSVERLTFGSEYAVSPSVSPDGTRLTYVTRVAGQYRVAMMEIATREETILSKTTLDESPCFSPNGRMIVYASENMGRGVLATVSVDGSVTSYLTGPRGDIREPTWGPLLPEY